jgi:repressor LexA
MELTFTQRRVLKALAVLTIKRGFPPSSRDVCDALNISSTNAFVEHARRLKSKGAIQWLERKARTIHLTKAGWELLIGEDLTRKRSDISAEVLDHLRFIDE